ncbi:MAG: type II toxin-antitoxin system prevent-host-death family antitoxin [Lentisphaerae bacterium]|nr:type II toxin-antitoxin system prevent-host-death family antitoxin [Lentisphaerota bacterium]
MTTTVREARLNFSRLLARVQRGEEIIIRNRQAPVAKLVPFKISAAPPFPDLTAWRGAMRKFMRNRGDDSSAFVRRMREERG